MMSGLTPLELVGRVGPSSWVAELAAELATELAIELAAKMPSLRSFATG